MNLSTIPIPADADGPARAKVTSLPDGSWSLAFAVDGGRRVEPVGPPFGDVRAACRAAAALNQRTGQ